MQLTNAILARLNKNTFGRKLLAKLIYLRYKQRGKDVREVKYLSRFGAWQVNLEGRTFLSSGPGWAYDYDFLLNQLKELSGHDYLPGPRDVVFDIGAGVGEETIIFSQLVGEEGKVYAIEAHPKTFGALIYMTQKNSLRNVVCVNVALSDKPGVVEIDDTENSLANTILPTGNVKAFKVEAHTFDDFVQRNGINKIDLVKMNVEGAEQLIVKGMVNSLPMIRNVAISCHDFLYNNGQSEFFKTKDKVIAFLTSNGFVVKTQQANQAMVEDYVYAVNPRFRINTHGEG